MSKRRKEDTKPSDFQGARVKLRLLEFDMEGEHATLLDGVKSIASALAPTAVMPVTARRLASAAPVSRESRDTTEAQTETPSAERHTDPSDALAPELTEQPPPVATVGNDPDRPKRRAAPRAPKFLNDLDLTRASVHLADFVREKQEPSGDMERYAVIAAWFAEHQSIEEICIDHVFTAYSSLGWRAEMPSDPSQTFRNLKHKNWFEAGSKRGYYKINWNGLNAVNKKGAVRP